MALTERVRNVLCQLQSRLRVHASCAISWLPSALREALAAVLRSVRGRFWGFSPPHELHAATIGVKFGVYRSSLTDATLPRSRGVTRRRHGLSPPLLCPLVVSGRIASILLLPNTDVASSLCVGHADVSLLCTGSWMVWGHRTVWRQTRVDSRNHVWGAIRRRIKMNWKASGYGYWLHGFPALFTDTSERVRFYF